MLGDVVGWSPFWCAGTVDANATVLATKGKVGFTCTRTATGVYQFNFNTPHPDGQNYVVNATSSVFHAWVVTTTAEYCLIYVANAGNRLTNATVHFSVLA